MSKYEVLIARNETTLYTIYVEANDEKQAEQMAYKEFQQGYVDREKVVFGEENTHEVNYIGETENA